MYRSKYVTCSSEDCSIGYNNLNLLAKFGNQTFKTYSGFSISQVSFINNFYNVTSKNNTLKVLVFKTLQWVPYTLVLEPGFYYENGIMDTIVEKIKAISPLPVPDYEIGPPNNYRIRTINFKIVPYSLDVDSKCSWMLGFIDEFYKPVTSSQIDGHVHASHENKLYWNQIAYLHSRTLKTSNSIDSTGSATSIVATICLNNDQGTPIFLDNHVAANNPHHLFNTKKDITEIDFQLCDENGQFLECSHNNLIITLRLFK